MKMRTVAHILLAVTAIGMALFAYLVAYGPMGGTPEDATAAAFAVGGWCIIYYAFQSFLSSIKKGGNISSVLIDIVVSVPAVLISGYALFQETAQNANDLSQYQQDVIGLIFLATLADLLINTIGDLVRLLLTDDVKVVN